MTREAANALLKTLEEPPAGTHIFLLVHHRNQLLPTLVSRCQSVRFDPIAEDEVRRLLEDRGVEPRVAEWMAEVSGGCPGAVCGEDPEAFEAAESELVDVWERWEQWSVADRFSVASRWATEKDRIGTRLEGLERIARRRVRQAAAQGEADDRALDVLEALYRVRRLMDQNVNTQLALDALFQGLAGRDWEEFS